MKFDLVKREKAPLIPLKPNLNSVKIMVERDNNKTTIKVISWLFLIILRDIHNQRATGTAWYKRKISDWMLNPKPKAQIAGPNLFFSLIQMGLWIRIKKSVTPKVILLESWTIKIVSVLALPTLGISMGMASVS